LRYIEEPAKRLEVLAEADVVVAGGGPGGFPAAIAAARNGAKTVLLERYGFMGGMATAGLVRPILGHTAADSELPILGGIPKELCERLHKVGAAPKWEDTLSSWGVPFDPELMKVVLDDFVEGAGVEILLHTFVVDAVVQDSELKAVIVESKSGRQAVLGKLFVDATGDADLACRAGVPTHMGGPADGLPMAMGSMFRIGGVRPPEGEERKRAAELITAARERGEIHVYNSGVPGKSSKTQDIEATPNVTRFSGDPTDVRTLTKGEISLRRETIKVLDCYRKVIPGFEKARIAALPTQIGLRESRQIEGGYDITGKDIVEARKFDDAVTCGSWWIDIHCPRGNVRHGVHLCCQGCPDPECNVVRERRDEIPDNLRPPKGEWYDIPYRSLLPKKVSNLLVSGRCISATHQGMAGVRVMGTCMAIGEAAGTAAAMAAKAGVSASALPVKELQNALEGAGAVLRPGG